MKIHIILKEGTTREQTLAVIALVQLRNVNWDRAIRYRILSGVTDISELPAMPDYVVSVEYDKVKQI